MIRSPKEIKDSNLWEKAGQGKPGASSAPLANSNKQTFVVLGEPQSGKTSLIKLLKNDSNIEFSVPSSTQYLVDYFFLKKDGINLEFFQIGSLDYLEDLLPLYVNDRNLASVTIILCVDLSIQRRAENIVSRINKIIVDLRSVLKSTVDTIAGQSNKKQVYEAYTVKRSRAFHRIEANADRQFINRMALPFLIVGTKYDLYEKMNVEQKKWVSRTLRYFSHVNEGSVCYSSTKNMQLGAELRTFFMEICQREIENRSKESSREAASNRKDHNKPIFISVGEDTVAEMSLPALNNSGAFNEVKILEQQLDSVFSSKLIEAADSKDQSKSHKRTHVDELIERNKKELKRMLEYKINPPPTPTEKQQHSESGEAYHKKENPKTDKGLETKISKEQKNLADQEPQSPKQPQDTSVLQQKEGQGVEKSEEDERNEGSEGEYFDNLPEQNDENE